MVPEYALLYIPKRNSVYTVILYENNNFLKTLHVLTHKGHHQAQMFKRTVAVY